MFMQVTDCWLILFRHIYWTDWGLGTIERASYDGRGRTVLVRGEEKWINGLALDLLGQLCSYNCYSLIVVSTNGC